MSDVKQLKLDFMKSMHSPEQLAQLFEHLPDVYFFVKNTDGLFVMCNKLFYTQCGAKSEEEIIGKSDYDLFPRDRAVAYIKDDRQVMLTGKSIIDQIELGPEPSGIINWFIATKVPVYSWDMKIIGIAGVARDVRNARSALTPYSEMASIIDYINKNYYKQISTKELAARAHLSPSHFERKFKKTFKISPAKYLLKTRIKAACNILISTSETISSIAQEVGFYDHSHFTKHFTREMGTNPKNYRNTH